MSYLRPIPDAVPPELRRLPWVVWKNKQPYRVRDPRKRASSTDPATWSSFDEAVALVSSPQVDGIGVVLTAEAGVTCLDLDHVIDDEGSLDRRAQTIVERCIHLPRSAQAEAGYMCSSEGASRTP
jgi:primase-polymerase (primpol)-like protein